MSGSASEFEITSVERVEKETAASLVFGTPGSVKAGYVVKGVDHFNVGDTYHFSKLDGDDAWRLDACVKPNGYPVFMHGPFSIMSKTALDPALTALFDAAVDALR
jgi:hypothetical protein